MSRRDDRRLTSEPVDAYREAKLFALWAGSGADRWRCLLGCAVLHHRYGRGTVHLAVPDEDRLEVTFDDPEPSKRRRFALAEFPRRFALPTLPQLFVDDEQGRRAAEATYQLQQLRKERRLEGLRRQKGQDDRTKTELAAQAEARADFKQLKEAYGACSHSSESPLSPLYKVLLLLRDGQPLTSGDCAYLESEGLFWTLAIYFTGLYRDDADPWNAARASGYWRKAGLPERARELQEPGQGTDARARSAFYTSRAGASADLGRLPTAVAEAQLANRLRPHDPMTLKALGRIHYMLAEPELAQAYFEEAELLGESAAEIDRIRQRETRRLPAEGRAKVAMFLVARDSGKYAWAMEYIDQG